MLNARTMIPFKSGLTLHLACEDRAQPDVGIRAMPHWVRLPFEFSKCAAVDRVQPSSSSRNSQSGDRSRLGTGATRYRAGGLRGPGLAVSYSRFGAGIYRVTSEGSGIATSPGSGFIPIFDPDQRSISVTGCHGSPLPNGSRDARAYGPACCTSCWAVFKA